MQIDDETLMALADGELEPDRAARLRRAIASDPALQARLHRFEETRRLLAGLRQDSAAEDPLAAMIRRAATAPGASPVLTAAWPGPAPHQSDPTLTAPKRDSSRPANVNARPWLAAAASAAIVAFGLGWWEWAGGPVAQFGPEEVAALDALPSGQVRPLDSGGELAMIASFRAADGALCREYETSHDRDLRIVLACRNDGAWQQRFASVSQDGGEHFRPASGQGSIDDAIAAIGAAAPLSPVEEAAALGE